MDRVPGADDTPSSAGDAGERQAHPERHPDDLSPADLPAGRPRPAIPSGVLWALALAVVVLAIASWVAFSNEQASVEPDARLTDPNATVGVAGLGAVDVTGQPVSATPYTTFDGSTSTLTAFAGTPMVVNFWASDCPPCITEMPALEAVHREVEADVAFVGLAVKDREDAARALAERTGVTYELGFDTSGDLLAASGGVVLPTTVFIDGDGTIVETHHGELDAGELRSKVATHFGAAAAPGS